MAEPRTRAVKPNSLVASAKILTTERINQPKTNAWQEECWGHYDLSGEAWFSTLWLSNAMSKMRLYAATPPQKAGDEPTPILAGAPVALMEQFAGGVSGQSQILSDTATYLTVPGEGFLVAQTDASETSWKMYSNDELKVAKNVWQVRLDQRKWEDLPEESLVIRVWRPHKRRHWLADSPMRHALPALREIQRCNDHIDATLVSRLAGSGLLIMPNEVTFPIKPENADKPDPFFAELIEAMTVPIKDRGTAAAVVPLPIRVPGEQAQNFVHLKFDTLLDQKVLDLRTNAIERFATTVDFPSDILLGKGDVNHWTAWQISEEGLQMHIEPLAEIICQAYTDGWLVPSLKALGEDPDVMIWYDSSELAVRPDRSADSKWMFADAIIGHHAAIRETGFTEADRPTEDEYREMVAWRLMGVRDMGPLALSLLGIEYDKSLIPQAGVAPGSVPGQAPQVEPISGPDAPGPDTTPPPPISGPPATRDNAPPGPDLPSAGATILVADQLIYRALEKAGNRLRTLRKGKLTADQDCPPPQMHECLGGIGNGTNENGKPYANAASLLEGAWERVPEAAMALGEDPVKMQRALQRYCMGLLTTGSPHTIERLAEFLADELPSSMAALVASGDGLQMGIVREMSRSMARLTETLAKQPPPVIQVATPAPELHLDGPVSVSHAPPQTRRVERDADGNISRIIEEGPAPEVRLEGPVGVITEAAPHIRPVKPKED